MVSDPFHSTKLSPLNKPAGIQEHLVTLVLFRVEHVVAFLAESDTNEPRAFRHFRSGNIIVNTEDIADVKCKLTTAQLVCWVYRGLQLRTARPHSRLQSGGWRARQLSVGVGMLTSPSSLQLQRRREKK